MNPLLKYDIPLNLELAFVGLDRKLISIKSVVENIEPKIFEIREDDFVANLYIAAEDSDPNTLKKFIAEACGMSNEKYQQSSSIWGTAFLLDIHNSELQVNEKLNAIAETWALFDYPNEWRPFINYLPPEENHRAGVDAIYKRFQEYLELRKAEIGQYR